MPYRDIASPTQPVIYWFRSEASPWRTEALVFVCLKEDQRIS